MSLFGFLFPQPFTPASTPAKTITLTCPCGASITVPNYPASTELWRWKDEHRPHMERAAE